MTVTTQIDGPASSPLYSRQHLASLHSHRDIVNALAHLESTEFNLDGSLADLLASPDRLESPLTTIDELQSVVSSLAHDASTLHEVVTERAAVAERISSKVRILDLEQSRVKDCIDRVQATTELKDAFVNIFRAIEKADWEAATRHIQRANSIPMNLLHSKFAEAVVPTADIPDPPPIALQNFTQRLTSIFLKAFTTAATSKDEAATTRFFKLFPLLGPSSSEAGLTAYSDFVRTLISLPTYPRSTGTGASQGKPCLPQLTSLFEQLALIIDQHQPVVDKYYGVRSMLTVVSKLNIELDRHAGRILATWNEDRQPHRKLSEVSNYSFPYLNQILTTGTATNMTAASSLMTNLNVSNPSASYPISAINSPAGLQSSLRSFAGNVQRTYNLQPSLSTMSNSSTPSHAGPVFESETPDPKAIDSQIAELAGMSGRWQTYRRFLYARFGDNESDSEVNGIQNALHESSDPAQRIQSNEEKRVPTNFNQHLRPLEQTEFSKTIHDMLHRVYAPLEVWYLRINIEKAHTVDEMDLVSLPFLSSALDDTFFMTKKVLYRAINAADVSCVRNVLHDITEIVVRDFGDVIKHRLDSIGASIGGGGFGIGNKSGDGRDKREKNATNSYIVYLNDLDMASEYIVKLVDEMMAGDALRNSFFVEEEAIKVREALTNLKDSQSKFTAITKAGVEQLFNQLVRPRIRPMLSDCYKDVNYLLDEEKYAEAESLDLFRKRFIRAWEALTEHYQTALTPTNFNQLLAATVNMFSRQWETQIRNMRFTELGAMRYDRDLRSVASFLSNQTSFGISLINESFIRLRQISMLLGLNEKEDDLKDFLVSDEITWRLTMVEIKAVLAQKS